MIWWRSKLRWFNNEMYERKKEYYLVLELLSNLLS